MSPLWRCTYLVTFRRSGRTWQTTVHEISKQTQGAAIRHGRRLLKRQLGPATRVAAGLCVRDRRAEARRAAWLEAS